MHTSGTVSEIGTMTEFLYNKPKTKDQPVGFSPNAAGKSGYLKMNEYYNNDRSGSPMSEPGGLAGHPLTYLSPSKRKRRDSQGGGGGCPANIRFQKSNSITAETDGGPVDYHPEDFRRFHSLRGDRRNDLSLQLKQQAQTNYVNRSQPQPKGSYQYRDKYSINAACSGGSGLNNNGGRSELNFISGGDNYSSSSSDYRYIGFHQKNDGPSPITVTVTTTPNKSSLKRGTGLSTHSLCSCDADTEVIPNPLRPLYQYSLDRKKPRHTYTCEQNAQILMRLEKEHQKKIGSTGKLHLSSSCDHPTDHANSDHSSFIDYSPTIYPETDYIIESDPYNEDILPPPPPPTSAKRVQSHHSVQLDQQQQQQQQQLQHKQQQQHHHQPIMKKTSNSSTSASIISQTAMQTSTGTLSLVGPAATGNNSNTNNGVSTNGNNNSSMPIIQPPASSAIRVVTPLKLSVTNNKAANSSNNNNNNENSNHSNKASIECGTAIFNCAYNTSGGGGSGGGGGGLNKCEQLTSSKPDLFNFAANKASAKVVDGKKGSLFTTTMAGRHNDDLPQPIISNGSYQKPTTYPPYYFDEMYGGGGVGGAKTNHQCSVIKNKENDSLFFYHHEPASYYPNYENGVPLRDKYKTIGGHAQKTGYLDTVLGPGDSKMHASTCNLNQFASGNLLSTQNFSSSLTNFNFNHYHHDHVHFETPLPYTQFHDGSSGTGLGASTIISGSYTSGGGGTPKPAQWKHNRNCPSRGSSSSGNSSAKWDLPSRQWLAVTSILLIAGAAGVAVPLALRVAAGAPFEERLQAATQLLDTVPLIDGHNDLPWNIRKFLHNQLNEFSFDEDLRNVMPWAKSSWSHTDLLRMRKGRLSSQFWAAYVPCEAQYKDAVQITLEQIDVINRLTERYSPKLTKCTSVADINAAHKNHQICSLIGVEGGHSLGGSLGVLRIYYLLGVRYMTLTSTCNTPWADSSNADAPKFDVKHGGVTNYGKTIVREMNRLGMIVDLSKSSLATMKDVLAVSEAPVIFSHSSAFALCNSSRNVQDVILEQLAKNRGLVMVNFYSMFLSCSENATVHDAVAHINHIRRVAGIDHVGLGAGYDGINFTPKGLEDVSGYPTLFAELLGDGWTVDDLTKLAGQNFLRVLHEVEKVRNALQLAGARPYEEVPLFKNNEGDPYNCSTKS